MGVGLGIEKCFSRSVILFEPMLKLPSGIIDKAHTITKGGFIIFLSISSPTTLQEALAVVPETESCRLGAEGSDVTSSSHSAKALPTAIAKLTDSKSIVLLLINSKLYLPFLSLTIFIIYPFKRINRPI